MNILAITVAVAGIAFLGNSCVNSRSLYGGPPGQVKKVTGFNPASGKYKDSKYKNNGNSYNKGKKNKRKYY